MNDPWDVKSVRKSNQYMSCMKLNGVPLLPPVLSKECRKEMQYYKLLAREVEKRIQSLKPFIVESDSESSEDKTDAPELPESEQSFEVPVEDNKNIIGISIEKVTPLVTEKCLDDSASKIFPTSNTYDNITTNFTADDSVSSKLSSKLVIDLSLSINETGKTLIDSVNSSQTAPNDLPERDYNCLKNDEKELVTDVEKTADRSNISKEDKLNFHVSINKDAVSDPITLQFSQDGPSSLSTKSFTGSLNDLHTESIKESPIPLTRQRSYTVLKPSPMLLAHLEVQSINTGIDVTSISMSESMSNLSYANKKRRSWDLESAKVKWSSMALELKEKTINNGKNVHSTKNAVARPTIRRAHTTTPKTKSLIQERNKRSSPKALTISDPIQKGRKAVSPVRNTTPNSVKTPATNLYSQNKEIDVGNKKIISESDDPATRVRELYEKIQKQQIIQMANLVEKQKKEQMLLQQVFEEQNNLLFTQLKTICPKSPNEAKEAWVDKTGEVVDSGPVSLSQLINTKTEQNVYNSPVYSTLTETNDYLNYCDNVLKKSRDITGSIKKQTKNISQQKENITSPKPVTDGSRTRTNSPVRKTTPTSRKLTYETSVSSDQYDPILTDRTNDTMADLNVTFPSDHSDECQPFIHNTICEPTSIESPIPISTASCRSTDKAIRNMEETIQNSINSMCGKTTKPNVFRIPTPHERLAATKIVAHAKGYLVRRLMQTERVQATVQTIKDALLCALQLHQDREGIRGADVDLHRRLIQQITAACYSLHDTFVASTPAERCAMIASDRSRRKLLAARVSPALPVANRHYRPTDIMSQSHSGVFPARSKRPPPSIMSQSNYETYSSDKIVRRYMPSPRRRPWR